MANLLVHRRRRQRDAGSGARSRRRSSPWPAGRCSPGRSTRSLRSPSRGSSWPRRRIASPISSGSSAAARGSSREGRRGRLGAPGLRGARGPRRATSWRFTTRRDPSSRQRRSRPCFGRRRRPARRSPPRRSWTRSRRVADGRIVETVDRSDLFGAATPQAFRADILRRALASGEDATDEAALCERLGIPVAVVPVSRLRFKITTPEDLELAEAILARRRPMTIRVGMGFDAHPFALSGELQARGHRDPSRRGARGPLGRRRAPARDHRRDPRRGGTRLDRRALSADGPSVEGRRQRHLPRAGAGPGARARVRRRQHRRHR